MCGVHNNKAFLYTSHLSTNGFYAGPNEVGMKFGNGGYWIDNQGTHMSGNKKFTMRVPELTRARGGMWLSHCCTESPYDGIEYWENVEIGADGTARWELPDYVPKIASAKAPWVVFTGAEGSSASLDRSNPALWVVNVKGIPGTAVPVLVKGARMIDVDVDESGEPIMRDYAREAMWDLPPSPPTPEERAQDASEPENLQETHLGGGYYGPAPLQKENQ